MFSGIKRAFFIGISALTILYSSACGMDAKIEEELNQDHNLEQLETILLQREQAQSQETYRALFDEPMAVDLHLLKNYFVNHAMPIIADITALPTPELPSVEADEVSSYHRIFNIIFLDLEHSNLQESVVELVHEYVHFLQDFYGLSNDPILREGQAREVEVAVARRLSDSTGDARFYNYALRRQIVDLRTIVSFLNDEDEPQETGFGSRDQIYYEVEEHGLGTSLFLLREQQWQEAWGEYQSNQILPRSFQGDYCQVLNSPQENDCGITDRLRTTYDF